MPFGFEKCASAFQNMMNDIFKNDLDDLILVYLDDILVYSKNEAEHALDLGKGKEIVNGS
jgi:hypothetical protein